VELERPIDTTNAEDGLDLNVRGRLASDDDVLRAARSA
jgi:hypothetical protein